MALPLIGFALRSIMMANLRGAIASTGSPKLTVSLSRGGRGIKKAVRRATKRTDRAALMATNRIGKLVRAEARAALAKQLEVTPATVRRVEKAQAAFRGSKRPAYTIRWTPDRLPVARVRSKQFKAYRGSGGKRGKLSLKLWKSGRRVVLEGVVKSGRTFILPARGGLPERAVGGPRISRGSAPSKAALDPIRRGLRKRYKREFRRQLKLSRGRT